MSTTSLENEKRTYDKGGKWPCTTGNSNAAEGFLFCRGPDFGHSAKDIFAEGQPSAKSDLRQRLLRRGPGPRQRNALG